jgi:V/A-type H+-transporting ATPase subunit G/H
MDNLHNPITTIKKTEDKADEVVRLAQKTAQAELEKTSKDLSDINEQKMSVLKKEIEDKISRLKEGLARTKEANERNAEKKASETRIAAEAKLEKAVDLIVNKFKK